MSADRFADVKRPTALNSVLGGLHYWGGMEKGHFEHLLRANHEDGSLLGALALLYQRSELRIRVEATLSQLLNRVIRLEMVDGKLMPRIRFGVGVEYGALQDECHGVLELLVLLGNKALPALFSGLLLLFLSGATGAEFDRFDPGLSTGARCLVEIGKLRPVQFAVGMKEVELRVGKIRTMSRKKLEAYLKDHIAPIAIGPGGVPYLLDHHHLARCCLASGASPTLYAEIKANWADVPAPEFWERMKTNNWVYLYDENGKGPLDPSALPQTVAALRDDPWRSLAWAVREKGGFGKTEAPFAEFQWANFFRTRIAAEMIRKDFDKAVSTAMKLCLLPEARDLPGFSGKSAP